MRWTVSPKHRVVTAEREDELGSRRQQHSVSLCLFLQTSVDVGFSEWLSAGHWFISVYNDDSEFKDVLFLVTVSENSCPEGKSK